MKNRRNLTPPPPPPSASTPSASGEGTSEGVHATRRGGARHEVSARVAIKTATGEVYEGWALNVSRGGVRVILEDKVNLGNEFEVTLIGVGLPPAPGAPAAAPSANQIDPAVPQSGRVVWVQEEPDGLVVGIEFVTAEPGTHKG